MREKLTPMQQKIYDCIVLNGLSQPEIMGKFYIERTTVATHINDICNRLGYEGTHRLLKLTIDHYINVLKGKEKMRNCTQCKYYTLAETCENPKSQYYMDLVNEYQICREFGEEKHVDNNKQSDK